MVKLNRAEHVDPFHVLSLSSEESFIFLKRSTNTDATGIRFIDLLSGPDQGGPVRIHIT